MSFNPQKLRDIVATRGGLATNEKYQVSFFNLPSGLDISITNTLTFYCETVALPTKSISASEKMIYGTSYQMPYRQAFQELSMTFYLTDDMAQKKFFDNWQALIVDPTTGDLEFHENYTCNMKIKKYGHLASGFGDTPTYEIEIIKAWPSIVAEVQLSHGGGNEIARLPVTMQYKKWLPTSGNRGGTASIDT